MTKDGVDLINTLPDVILQHILSFISTRFAIRTSVLSKRWKHVWSDTPALDFDFWYKMREPNIHLVNKTLTRYTPRKMMSFHLHTIMEEHIPYVDGWIEFVISRNVEIMSQHLHIPNYNIPDFFYINPSLKELTLSLNFHKLKIPTSCSVSWTSLKKLSLRSCGLSCKSVDKVLSGCPVLKSLKLCHYNNMRIKVLDLSKSLCLRRLEIDHCIWVDPKLVQIVAPHIHYLKFTNSKPPCSLVDVSSLTEARLEPLEEPKTVFNFQDKVLNMLEKLHNVEKLTFGAILLKILSFAELRGLSFPCFKVKDLTLETIFEDGIPGLEWLIQNSPELKKLTVHGTIPEKCFDKLVGFAGLEIISANKTL